MPLDLARGPRRIFVRVQDPEAFLREASTPRGAFVPTRVALSLGEPIQLAVRLKGVAQPIELPAVVLGRRAPRGARGLLSTGALLRITDLDDPMVTLLREASSGRVVDLEARIQERARLPVTSVFASEADMLQELALLVRDEAGLFPVGRPVQAGDRLKLTVGYEGGEARSTFCVLVKGTSHYDGARSCRGVLFDHDSRYRVRSFLESRRARQRALRPATARARA
jgi:hypothetical protein